LQQHVGGFLQCQIESEIRGKPPTIASELLVELLRGDTVETSEVEVEDDSVTSDDTNEWQGDGKRSAFLHTTYTKRGAGKFRWDHCRGGGGSFGPAAGPALVVR
jgi:hypothetical protein